MSHPKMFDDDDQILARLRQLCLSFPAADEKVSHGRPSFFTKKIFAIYGAVTKGAAKGDDDSGRFDHAVIFMPDPGEAPALDADDRIFVPAYWGPYGWRAIDLAGPSVDWEEIAELIEDSYRQTATAKLIAQLEER